MSKLDKTDRRILTILHMDGRIAAVELADRIGLSPTSTGERSRRLQREATSPDLVRAWTLTRSALASSFLSKCFWTKRHLTFLSASPNR